MHKISPKCTFIGQKSVFVETTRSTNDLAKEILREQDDVNGLVIRANYQVSGRGREQNFWFGDASKNLYVSTIVQPLNLAIKDIANLNFACALAVCDTLDKYLPSATSYVKWPNDIMVNDRKIAGMLIENQLGSQKLKSSVFGLGLNVNQDEFPIGLIHATSILQQKGEPVRMEEILETLCEMLENRINQLQQMQYQLLHAQYNHRLYKRGEHVSFKHDGSAAMGTIVEVGNEGQLIMDVNGQVKSFIQGEVKLDVYGSGN